MGMLVLRAESITELDTLIRDSDELLSAPISGLNETMQAISVVQGTFPQSSVVGSEAAPQGKTCAHGVMAEKWGNRGTADEWHGWFCPLPKGDPNKCRPVYPGK